MPHSANDFDYDVIVIGAGPAGYAAAIRAAELGFKTASVDCWQDAEGNAKLGGTYVNAGCIGRMCLMESAKLFQQLKTQAAEHGIGFSNLSLNLTQMQARKNKLAITFSRKISDCFAGLNIARLFAKGRLLNAKQIEVTNSIDQQKSLLSAKYIILANGSSPIKLPFAQTNNHNIINAQQALNLDTVPKRLGILGAGIVGVELAGIWQKLGADVTLLEAQNTFLPPVDHEVAQTIFNLMQQQGINILLGSRVTAASATEQSVTLSYQDQQAIKSLELDTLIIASGHKPNSENLAAPEAQLLLDENGFVHVDERCATNLPGVYAIGDLISLGSVLAHKGIAEGIYVAEQLAGMASTINYKTMPNIIYADPEIAWVGQTEQSLLAIGEQIECASFPFQSNAKAHVLNKTDGFAKLIKQTGSDKLLGIHIIGPHAAELIAEAVLALEFSASSEDLARTIHGHPTLACVLHKAALKLNGRALH